MPNPFLPAFLLAALAAGLAYAQGPPPAECRVVAGECRCSPGRGLPEVDPDVDPDVDYAELMAALAALPPEQARTEAQRRHADWQRQCRAAPGENALP